MQCLMVLDEGKGKTSSRENRLLADAMAEMERFELSQAF